MISQKATVPSAVSKVESSSQLTKFHALALLKHMIAGAGSGAFTKTAVAPLERIKILFQVQGMKAQEFHGQKYTSITQALRLVVKEEGLMGLYLGNGANVIRIIPVYALKFGFNDSFKDLVRRKGQKEALGVAQLIVAGTSAGLFQQLLTYPLEVVRTRLSLGSSFGANYSGIGNCIRQTVRKEGIRGLYKGIGPTMISGAPYVGLQMTFYDLYKRNSHKLTDFIYNNESNDNTGNNNRRKEYHSVSILSTLFGGAISGLIAQTLTYPGDTVRRQMITNGINGEKRRYRDSWDCMWKIVRRDGYQGLYRGLSTNAVRCIPGAAIQFAVYDALKKIIDQ